MRCNEQVYSSKGGGEVEGCRLVSTKGRKEEFKQKHTIEVEQSLERILVNI